MIGIDRDTVLRNMCARDIQSAFKAYEFSQRESWEQTRILAFNTAAPYLKREINAKSFLPLPWDTKIKADVKPHSRDEFEKLKKLYKLEKNG